MTVRIGDLLVRKGVLTGAQRDQVLAEQVRSGRPFGELAERLFGVTPPAIEQAWAEQYASITRSVDPMAEQAEAGALALIDRRQAWQFRLIPLRFDGPELMVCTSQEHLVRALKFLGWRVKERCFFVLCDPLALGRALERYYPMPGMTAEMVAGKGLAVVSRAEEPAEQA